MVILHPFSQSLVFPSVRYRVVTSLWNSETRWTRFRTTSWTHNPTSTLVSIGLTSGSFDPINRQWSESGNRLTTRVSKLRVDEDRTEGVTGSYQVSVCFQFLSVYTNTIRRKPHCSRFYCTVRSCWWGRIAPSKCRFILKCIPKIWYLTNTTQKWFEEIKLWAMRN